MNPIKVISFVFFLSICFGGRWEEADRIELPNGFVLKDFVRDYRGDIYLLGVNQTLKYDWQAKQALTIDETPVCLLIPTHKYGLLLLRETGELIALGEDIAHLKIPAQSSVNLFDGTAFEDSAQFFILLLYKNQLAIYKDDAEQGSLPIQAKEISLIPNANYLDNRVPFFTAIDNHVYLWQGGNLTQLSTYRGQTWLTLRQMVGDIAASANGELYIATAESIYIYDQQGNKEDVIGNTKRSQFTKIRLNTTLDTIYVFDRLTNNIVIYVKKDKISSSAGPISLEKNQPNPLESYTDIEFVLTEPLEIKLVVYNLIGGPVKVLVQGSYNKGRHQLRWDGKDDNGKPLPNGVYFYRLESRRGVRIRQLIIMR